MARSVRVIDRGYNETLARVFELSKGSQVTVGIHEEKGGKIHSDRLSVADIGAIHERGTATIPRRSWLSDTIDGIRGKLGKELAQPLRMAIQRKIEPNKALGIFGLYVVGQIQSRMSDGIPPPLAPQTIQRKGSSTPLIDTGQLRAAMSHKVHLQGKGDPKVRP